MRSPSILSPSTIILLLTLCSSKTVISQPNNIVNDDTPRTDETESDTCAIQQCPPDDKPSDRAPRAAFKSSELCPPSRESIPPHSSSSSLQRYYDGGMSAQAYKPNAPAKNRVCAAGGEGRIARNPMWRSSCREALPLIVRANVYSCSSDENGVFSREDAKRAAMEVWQPRPDGTYSSLRDGVQDGDCRATVPFSTDFAAEGDYSNNLGSLSFETVTPGSPGRFGGIVPSSSSLLFGDHPPYGPGKIHFLLTIDGYYPLLAEISTKDVGDALSRDVSGGSGKVGGRFHFMGSDWRPHGAVRKSHDGGVFGGMEIQSATMADSKIEVELDFYLVPISEVGNTKSTERLRPSDMLCPSDGGYFGTASFFKEPISVCYPSLLDFFAL